VPAYRLCARRELRLYEKGRGATQVGMAGFLAWQEMDRVLS